jgi:hypothetical protein
MKATTLIITGILATGCLFAHSACAADTTSWKSPLLSEKAFSPPTQPAPAALAVPAPTIAPPAVSLLASALIKIAATNAFSGAYSGGGCPDHVGSIGLTAHDASSGSTIACERPWGTH